MKKHISYKKNHHIHLEKTITRESVQLTKYRSKIILQLHWQHIIFATNCVLSAPVSSTPVIMTGDEERTSQIQSTDTLTTNAAAVQGKNGM